MADEIKKPEETAPAPVRNKGGRPKGSKDKQKRKERFDKNLPYPLSDDAEYNAKIIDFYRAVRPKTPADKRNITEMYERFEHYLDVCQERGMRVSNMAAYMAIGVSSQQFGFWLNQGENKDLKEFCQYVNSCCSTYRESIMIDNKINPATGIFWQKNYDGLKDQQEHVIQATMSDDIIDMDSLAKRYLESAASTVALPNNQPKYIDVSLNEKQEEPLPEFLTRDIPTSDK